MSAPRWLVTSDGNLLLARVGHLVINCGGVAPFTDQAVDELLAIEAELLAPLPADAPLGLLTWTLHAPDSRQRARLGQCRMMQHAAAAVMLSDSQLLRGAATALNWIVRARFRSRFLPTHALDEGLGWLAEQVSFDAAEAHATALAAAAHTGLRAR